MLWKRALLSSVQAADSTSSDSISLISVGSDEMEISVSDTAFLNKILTTEMEKELSAVY